MSRRAAALLAWSAWTLCVVLAAIAVLLALLTPPGATKSESGSNWGVFFSLSLLVYPTVGAFLGWRRPENLIGWLLCAIGFLFVIEGFALVYASYALSVEPDSLPGKQIALWVSGGFTSR
jgi:cytochrome bd-type quinol oxidase subunit 2